MAPDKDPVDVDQMALDVEAEFARSNQRRVLRWIGVGIGVILAGGLVTILRSHWVGNDGELPAILRAGPPTIVIGALIFAWGIVVWVRAK